MKKLSALIALSLLGSTAAYAAPGGSCAEAIPMQAPSTIAVDTTGGTGWINTYGPLVSPSNDIVYTFTTGDTGPTGTITPSAANYPFAVYLLSTCSAGAGPTPIATTGTSGQAINLGNVAGINPNSQYYVAVTGTAAGGAGANGAVTLTITPTLPVTLQNFEID